MPSLVDTDVMIEFLRGNEKARQFIHTKINDMLLSAVTVAELYAGIREGNERELLSQFLNYVSVVSIDTDIAKLGGLYKRDYGKSHGTGLADAIIAASANTANATLYTFNTKHFPMVNSLEQPYVK